MGPFESMVEHKWRPSLDASRVSEITDMTTLQVMRDRTLEKLDDLETGKMGSFAPGTYKEKSYPAMHGQLEADLELIDNRIRELGR